MAKISKKTTWSYNTTKILLAVFFILMITSVLGIFSQNSSLETMMDPEKDHASHLLNLEHNASQIITLYSENTYSIYVKSNINVGENDILLINTENEERIKANSTAIFQTLFSENGNTFKATHTWYLLKDHEVEIQNSAEGEIWLINESKIVSSAFENEILLSSCFGCLASICLIPIIIMWFIINKSSKNELEIKFISNDQEFTEPKEIMQFNNRMPNSDELFRAIHGNDEMKKDLVEEIEKEIKHAGIPAPFSDRPDNINLTNESFEEEERVLPKAIDLPEEKEKDQWKEWDG